MSSKNQSCRFRDPLTRADLMAIKDRGDAADVPGLLWEIARLRSLVLRANQLQASMGPASASGYGIILTALREELEGEPCVDEMGAAPR